VVVHAEPAHQADSNPVAVITNTLSWASSNVWPWSMASPVPASYVMRTGTFPATKVISAGRFWRFELKFAPSATQPGLPMM
jgi:hypothetical protein